MSVYQNAPQPVEVAVFREALHQEYLADVPVIVSDKVWNYAWEQRHSYGYSEVEYYYEGLAAVVAFAFQTGALLTQALYPTAHQTTMKRRSYPD